MNQATDTPERTPLREKLRTVKDTLGSGDAEQLTNARRLCVTLDREVAALEQERDELLTMNREILEEGKAEVERLRARLDQIHGEWAQSRERVERLRAAIRERADQIDAASQCLDYADEPLLQRLAQDLRGSLTKPEGE